MIISNSTLKARLYELTEERDGLKKELDALFEDKEDLYGQVQELKKLADKRVDVIREFAEENRKLKRQKEDENKLLEVANEVSDVFQKQGINLF